MPMWIRSVFLHYLPAMLLMKRPRKTRLRWMMEMPGMSVPPHPHPSYGSPTEMPKHIRYIHFFFVISKFIFNNSLCVLENLVQLVQNNQKWKLWNYQIYIIQTVKLIVN